MIVNNESIIQEIEQGIEEIQVPLSNKALMDMFAKDFSFRFCWSSNAIEGNTLSLDETVALIEYDEVKAGKPYSHYQEAKNLYCAISESMLPFHRELITERWIKKNNGIIMGTSGDYRDGVVYVGSLVEASYYPPPASVVPSLMKDYLLTVNLNGTSTKEIIEKIAQSHLDFERIHPFKDGNGRVGRMILNQQLINHGLLPVAIGPGGDYRKSFRIYDRNSDTSKLVHEICKAEISSIKRVQDLYRQMNECLSQYASLDNKIENAQKKTTKRVAKLHAEIEH